jgi:glycosyltransferase involved in cell wall biosynthesis
MRIAIDARMMGPLNTRGIGRYTEELIRAMLGQTDEHQFVLLTRSPELSPFLGHPHVEHLKADVPWYTFQEQIRMPRLYREAKADFLHVPHWNVAVAYHGPLVVTIHDLLLLHVPESAKISTRSPLVASVKRLAHRHVLRKVIHQAEAILVPTQFVAEDLAKIYPSTKPKTIVTGEGLSKFPSPDGSKTIDQPYLFYVGAAYPHKRLDLLFQAWEALHERYPDLHLVIAGEEDVFMARSVALVHKKNLPRVKFLGRVTDAELAGLYARARLFVFPSDFEGFGLPPVEALSYGCPVVSSDASSLPEVLSKEHVRFFRRGDADDMIRAIDSVLVEPIPSDVLREQRKNVVHEMHRWEEAALKTLAAYARIGQV